MNKYFLVAILIFGFIMAPLMFKSVGCKLKGGTPIPVDNPATGSSEMICTGGVK